MLSTGRLTVSYRLGSGPFSNENLLISWTDKSGRHDWKPGDKDDKNLGGIPASKLNDDRLARSLDAFFPERHAIMAAITQEVLQLTGLHLL